MKILLDEKAHAHFCMNFDDIDFDRNQIISRQLTDEN